MRKALDIAGLAFILVLGGVTMTGVSTAGMGWVLFGGGVLGLVISVTPMRDYHIRKPWYRPSEEDEGEERQEDNGVIFYQTQREMEKEWGGLTTELETLRHGWAAWSSGNYYSRQPESLRTGRLDRMLLWKPNNPLIEKRAEALDEDPNRVRQIIVDARNTAKKSGVDVRWTDAPVLNCVIHDPKADDAWARVQVQLRWLRSGDWPNFVVKKRSCANLFDNIVRAYQSQWDRANPA